MAKNDILKNNMYLPLSIDEGIYLRGCVRSYAKSLKQGDEREFLNRILDRLQTMIFDSDSYGTCPF